MAAGGKAGLSHALRSLRREHRWTLADVSARTGIPTSTLSKVENGRLSLGYDKLLRISQGLSVDIARLFDGYDPLDEPPVSTSNRRSYNRAGEGHHLQTVAYNYTYLATDLLRKQIDPLIAELRARSTEEFGEWIRHPGEEFAYVLEGEVELHTEVYSPLHLCAGDSVYFDSSMGHAYVAAVDGPCRILSCTTGRDGISSQVSVNRSPASSTSV